MVWVLLIQDRLQQHILMNEVMKGLVEFHSMCGDVQQQMVEFSERFLFP